MKKRLFSFFALLLALAIVSGFIPVLADEPVPLQDYDFAWRETPDSSTFVRIGYDLDEEALAVVFRSSETRTYVYSDFPPEDYDSFRNADSLGTWYNKYIKGRYPSARYDGDAPANSSKPSGDGSYYVLNISSIKFHVPSCASVSKMKDKNKEYFYGTREEAIEKGYSPCGNCKP